MHSPKTDLTPRGNLARLPHGGLPEVISPYLQKLITETGGIDGPIAKQFVANPNLERKRSNKPQDPLLEEEHEVAPGLVWKYQNRALWTVTRLCASYCRFCTRGREVGFPGNEVVPNGKGALSKSASLSQDQIEETLNFIKDHDDLKEIIVSGGDPLTLPQEKLGFILKNLGLFQRKGNLAIVRIGTRLPIHNPEGVKDWHYEAVAELKNPRLMVHVNHPAELTTKTLEVLQGFRERSHAIEMSQTVFLKGVNDDVKKLIELFTKLAENGINPYYLFQNDPVGWAEHFTIPINEAIALWKQVRPQLSGVAATARFVIDTPNGYGKIVVPEDSWIVDWEKGFKDFKGTSFKLKEIYPQE